jgi:uncharacterized Zn finger protein
MDENSNIQNTKQDCICLIYCPQCKETTNGVSFNLLKKTQKVFVDCMQCGGITIVRYDGEDVVFERG